MVNSPNTIIVTKKDITNILRDLGINPGSGLMVHSSLKSFGYVEGGTNTVIEALMEVITPKGTLMMPSFNHAEAFKESAPGYFNPLETPTTNGTIPNEFWKTPGVYRSLDPTHAFAAWGKNAKRYTEFHHRTLTMGPKSPLGLLFEDDGYCLLMGVDYSTNTFHHVVEMSTAAPCLGHRSEAYPVLLANGQKVEGRTWGWRESNCPHTERGMYFQEMISRDMLKEDVIGGSKLTLFRLKDCYEVVSNLLYHGDEHSPPCSNCKIRPQSVPQTVPSDWDKERNCLLPNSEAWDY